MIQRKIINNKKGTSLLELVTAVGIFVILSLVTTGIYLNIINAQKQTVAAQTTQESLRFVFEMMSKEIRTAQGLLGGSDCGPIPSSPGYNKIFNNKDNSSVTNSNSLYFKNKEGKCVVYYKESERIKVSRGLDSGFITPINLRINELKFIIKDNEAGTPAQTPQAKVTFMVDAETITGALQKIKMQTTITSRDYAY